MCPLRRQFEIEDHHLAVVMAYSPKVPENHSETHMLIRTLDSPGSEQRENNTFAL